MILMKKDCLLYTSQKYYYTDKEYANQQPIENEKSFYDLFNYRHIFANRNMPDEKAGKNSDKKKTISMAMIEFLGKEQWEELFKDWPEMILDKIKDDDIENKIRKKSLDSLSTVINVINETNGGRKAVSYTHLHFRCRKRGIG